MIPYLLTFASIMPWLAVMKNGAESARRIPAMSDLPADGAPQAAELPLLSVVIAARDESARVEAALQSLVAQSHPNFEIIIVDDRSTDGTGPLIDRMAAEFPERINAQHITELPEGWLGKCNALHVGGEAAKGEYILFTDADVEFERTVLERSHRYAIAHQADQIAVFPETIADTFWEKALLNVFALSFMMWFQPQRVMVRNSGKYVGIGAFNMVKTEMYRKIQGHRFLRMQVVDDVALGKLIKFSGGKIRMAWGTGFVRVRWQESLWGTIKGLEKNFFAFANYSIMFCLAAVLGILTMFVWPWVGLCIGSTGQRTAAAIVVLVQILLAAAAARRAGFSIAHGLTAQVGGILLCIAMLNSMWATLRRGGILWRDHFYPLKELKQFRL